MKEFGDPFDHSTYNQVHAVSHQLESYHVLTRYTIDIEK